jgi:hypothetical protein
VLIFAGELVGISTEVRRRTSIGVAFKGYPEVNDPSVKIGEAIVEARLDKPCSLADLSSFVSIT